MKLFLDFDNTIVDTTAAFCKYVEQIYGKSINPQDVKEYDFSDFIKLDKIEITNIFNSDILFNNLQPYAGVRYVLHNLKKSGLFEIYLISNSSDENIPKKLKWLKEANLDKYFDGKIMLSIDKPFDKSLINMQDSIFVDDHKLNHKTSNAKYKYCYFNNIGTNYTNWNPSPKKDNVKMFNSWDKKIIDNFIEIAKNK